MYDVIERFKGQLIVSCQAGETSPFHGPMMMAAFAWAAEMGGAGGLRVDKPCDIEACVRVSNLPVIGIYKVIYPESEVYITPTFKEAKAIVEAGASVIALDGTQRPRPSGETLEELIERIHSELHVPVMCDCATVEEGVKAAKAGADIVASTLAGYTTYSQKRDGPALDVVLGLVAEQDKPVIAEGRYWRPEQARAALEAGAYAVVVGTAITAPERITQQFVKAVREANA